MLGHDKDGHCLRVRELYRIHCSRERRSLATSLFSTFLNFVLSMEFLDFLLHKVPGLHTSLTCVLSQQAFLLNYLISIKTITVKYAIFVFKGHKMGGKRLGNLLQGSEKQL